MTWLDDALATMTVNDTTEGYLFGRGAQEASIAEIGCVNWQADSPYHQDPTWCHQFGPEGRGEYISEWLVLPFRGPRGQILGFESRHPEKKRFNRWLMPDAYWNPVWAGLTPNAMGRIWDGCDIWVVEGFFDLFALQWAVPKKDVVLGSVTAKMNAKQVEFLRRFCRGRVHLAYDNDESGRMGTHGWTEPDGKFRWGALQKLRHVGVDCSEVVYTGGKDPGEIWDRGGAYGVRAAFPQ